MYTGANSQTILERISWACANLVLPPSSAFLLLRSLNVFSRARGIPKAQTQRMNYLSFPPLLSLSYSRPYSHRSKSDEPPPPYPPPQPFVPLPAESVKSQVGLLRGYFEHRFASTGLDTLPDDPPNPAQAKLGPLGQVIRPSSAAIAAAAGSKKKAKPKDAATAGAGAATTVLAPTVGVATTVTAGTTAPGVTVGVIAGVVAGVVQPTTPVSSSSSLLSQLGGSTSTLSSTTSMAPAATPAGEPQPQSQTPKKKKAAPGAGSGAGGGAGGTGAGTGGGPGGGSTNKKRGRPPEGLPPVVVASA